VDTQVNAAQREELAQFSWREVLAYESHSLKESVNVVRALSQSV